MTEYAYHATTPQGWATIQREGLLPQPQAFPDEARCIDADVEATFFCPTAKLASVWGEVVVRFPWPPDAIEDDYGQSMLVGNRVLYTNWFTSLPVAPAGVELVTA